MNFKPNEVYHVFNRGNNREKIFFTDENYRFFLRKAKKHFLPYCRVIAYCLMPNHFHFLILINDDYPDKKEGNKDFYKLNHSIGVMLRSYARAINKQENRTGSLFQEETKAKSSEEQTSFISDYKESQINPVLNWVYYIHKNPVKAGLVKKTDNWEFSSAGFFARTKADLLCDEDIVDEIRKLGEL